MLKDGANKEDIIGFLCDKNLPGDEITLNRLAEKILSMSPPQDYLTNSIAVITNYDW